MVLFHREVRRQNRPVARTSFRKEVVESHFFKKVFQKTKGAEWAALNSKGVDADVRGGRARQNRVTPLHIAAQMNNMAMARLLLQKEADKNAKDKVSMGFGGWVDLCLI